MNDATQHLLRTLSDVGMMLYGVACWEAGKAAKRLAMQRYRAKQRLKGEGM